MYYKGQAVCLVEDRLPAIYLGKEVNNYNKTVHYAYCPHVDDTGKRRKITFEAEEVDFDELTAITEEAADTITGRRIYKGDCCTFELRGLFSDMEIKESTKDFQKEIRKLLKRSYFKQDTDE